jgi:CRP/FNR family cyclic AMP-dependent transcriptional regulator
VSAHSDPVCHLLREDPELAEAIPAERRRKAIDECVAREIEMPQIGGETSSERLAGRGVGLLILEGHLIRRVGLVDRFGAELVGEGDLLRPWHDQHDSPMLPLQTGWSVVNPARVAVLDESFNGCLSRYPELCAALVGRAVQRARYLAVQMAIVHQPRVEDKLHMLLWHLAGRWGRVRPDATVLKLRLTHQALAELVAARRQTVTTALSSLARSELVQTDGETWLLYGDPPRELLDMDWKGQHGSTRLRNATHS